MEFEKLLRLMVEKGGSDLFITAGVAPSMKVNGTILPVTKNALSPEQAREVVHSVMNEQQRRDFAENHECNFAISARGIGRFRVSAFYQRNLAGMVLRRIETNIPTIDQLKLPEILKQLAMTKRGLVLFVGATGTGKSTSLASKRLTILARIAGGVLRFGSSRTCKVGREVGYPAFAMSGSNASESGNLGRGGLGLKGEGWA